jgi:cold shock protein
MATGKVLWYNSAKRFGFIKPDDGSHDVFIQEDTIKAAGRDKLVSGEAVSYELGARNGHGKLAARNLKFF